MLRRPLIAGIFATLGSTVCATAAAQAAPACRFGSDGRRGRREALGCDFAARSGDPKTFVDGGFRSLGGHFAADA
jgi:hypothetical protein